MKKSLGLCLSSLVLSLSMGGCHIESHDFGDGEGICVAFCLRLHDCSSITGDQIGSCLDRCDAKFRADEHATVRACQCVLDDECRAPDAYDCPGAPFPGGSTPPTGSGGMNDGSRGGTNAGTGGVASSSGGTAAGTGGASSSGGESSATGGASEGGASGDGGKAADAGAAPGTCQSGKP